MMADDYSSSFDLCRAEKPKAVDQRLYEFGTVEYHIQVKLTSWVIVLNAHSGAWSNLIGAKNPR